MIPDLRNMTRAERAEFMRQVRREMVITCLVLLAALLLLLLTPD